MDNRKPVESEQSIHSITRSMDHFSAEQAKRIQALFDAALALDPSERTSYVMDSGSDLGADSLSRILNLLKAYDNADSILRDVETTSFADRQLVNPGDPFFLIGSDFHGYRIESYIGGGGMGVVYKARDERLQRNVAIKLLPPHLMLSEDAKQRFVREARAASPLDHRNIATVYDIGDMKDGGHFIVMAYYEGETLKEKIAQGPLDSRTAVDYSLQIAKGLEQAHKHGIVHRDIKPANLIVTENGDVKILDFGLAHVKDSGHADEGRVMGTPKYMSPEQTRGEQVDERSDIWSLGTVMYEMLGGTPAFESANRDAVIDQIQNSRVDTLVERGSEVLPLLSKVVDQSLQKSVTRRYQTSTDLLKDLTDVDRILDPGIRTSMSRRARYGLSAAVLAACVFAFIQTSPEKARTLANSMGMKILPEKKSLVILPASQILDKARDSEWKVDPDWMRTIGDRLQSKGSSEKLWVNTLAYVYDTAGVRNIGNVRDKVGVNLIMSVNRPTKTRYDIELIETNSGRQLRDVFFELDSDSPWDIYDELIQHSSEWLNLNTRESEALWAKKSSNEKGVQILFDQGMNQFKSADSTEDLLEVAIGLELVVEKDRDFAIGWAALASVYIRLYSLTKNQDWYLKADEAILIARDLNPEATEVQLALGQLSLEAGQLQTSEYIFDDILASGHASANVYRSLGNVYSKLDKEASVVSAFSKAIELEEGNWLNYHYLAKHFYFKESREGYFRAIKEWERALVYGQRNSTLWSNIGAAKWKVGDNDGAREAFLTSIDVEPNRSALNNYATFNFYEKEYETAIDYYKRALEITAQNNHYVSWGYLADAFMCNGDQEEAIDANQRALKLLVSEVERTPNNLDNQLRLAAAYWGVGNLGQSRISLNLAISLKPHGRDDLSRIAGIYKRLGQRDLAQRWASKALEAGFDSNLIVNHCLVGDFWQTVL